MEPYIWWIVDAVIVLGLLYLMRWAWHFAKAVQVERARELFRLQHERFETMLLKAASATGKPRGLTWMKCEIIGNAVLARDASRGLVALVPIVLHFEPIEGSDMENLPAAREPRTATAMFTFVRGHWHTDGRVVFNLNPEQALAHFGKQLTRVALHH